ncbi:hypothetical protein ACO0LG_07030 [Undibacterium sp. Ji42W]|uniref:hypothetical protein n=1 Tax=Undibacterium sp. Ji42W TaxID=3413039 RepID=UPI003BF0F163
MTSIDEPDIVELGRALGHDFFQFGMKEPGQDWPASVAEGFRHAVASDVSRKPTSRYINKYLQLRLNALRRRRHVDAQLTPELLQKIDVEFCPVTRKKLTHGELKDTDWSIDRLNNDAAYAPHNLAVMSTLANRAKGNRSYEQVFALSEMNEVTEDLSPTEWLRLAALMLGPCFATRPRLAPIIPLTTTIPKHTVRLAMQQIQYVFTTMAGTSAGRNALIKYFRMASPDEHARFHLRLLADSVHEGLKQVDVPWDVWLQPGIMKALKEWRSTLNLSAFAMAAEISMQLAGARQVDKSRLQTWRLKTGGYLMHGPR